MENFRQPTETEKIYIETHFTWLKQNELNVREIQNDIDHDQKTIGILTEKVEFNIKHVKDCEVYRKNGIVDFIDWCKVNDIDHTIYHNSPED